MSRNEPGVPLNKPYILNNCNNAIIYDFTPAYLNFFNQEIKNISRNTGTFFLVLTSSLMYCIDIHCV
jgi:hypothetical protein